MEASVRYIVDPSTEHAGDGAFKPSVCFRAREYAHCVVNADDGIRVVKVPVRDFDHSPVVHLKGENYPPARAATMMLAFTTRPVARRSITQRAEGLLRGILDGTITPEAIDAPPPPSSPTPAKAPATPRGEGGSLIATICAALNIEPTAARRTLRKHGMHAPYTDESAIRAILTTK